MRWFEVFFAIIPIKISLKMFFFSDEYVVLLPKACGDSSLTSDLTDS